MIHAWLSIQTRTEKGCVSEEMNPSLEHKHCSNILVAHSLTYTVTSTQLMAYSQVRFSVHKRAIRLSKGQAPFISLCRLEAFLPNVFAASPCLALWHLSGLQKCRTYCRWASRKGESKLVSNMCLLRRK